MLPRAAGRSKYTGKTGSIVFELEESLAETGGLPGKGPTDTIVVDKSQGNILIGRTLIASIRVDEFGQHPKLVVRDVLASLLGISI